MIIFLYGPDDYRREQKKKAIIAEFVKKHGALGVCALDFANTENVAELEAFTKNQSLFEPAKLAALENVFEADEKQTARLLSNLLHSKTLTALISAKEKKPTKAFSFLLKKPAISQSFEYLSGAEWTSYVLQAARDVGVSLTDRTATFLAAVYQNDSWRLVTGLQKLALLGGAAVDVDDLEPLDIETMPDFWAVMNGLRSPDVGVRMATLERVALREPAAKTFNVFSAVAKEKTPQFAEYDLLVKSGKLDYEEALLDFVIR